MAALQKLFGVAGKVAVVTGGARGIGLMIARTFVENGAKVYIVSRSAPSCERAAKELTAAGPGEAIAIPEDLATDAGCKAFAAKFAEREKALNVLVNNSGIAWGAPLDEFPEAQFDRVMALNVKTPFLMARALRKALDAAALPDDPSRIINIGSIVGGCERLAVSAVSAALARAMRCRGCFLHHQLLRSPRLPSCRRHPAAGAHLLVRRLQGGGAPADPQAVL